MFATHLHPVIYGDYPEIMKKHVGHKLPSFTPEQSKMLINSFDFIGINYYSARYTAHLPHIDPGRARFRTDQHFEERGINDYDDGLKSREGILNDTFRISYHKDHLKQLHKAIM
ncbi:hypothetical protein ARALYDRAFT_893747 [Arabidopsis lyrata subsp. lyrata]|uniref:Uncharacterized protein n=1 Tax=Arabidopsis lyrata subsp. lyrata TaxID=81972 RepID=D7KYM5_ARALL|nr:hypothetical protein ARALYDRAFT_893747 [Arabidopsis lyrata subsp. lyrata]